MGEAQPQPQERPRRSREQRGQRRPGILIREFWNLPNLLTFGRIVLIPLFVWFMYEADPLHSFYAALLFALAAITDVVDGVIARRQNLVTVLGKFMDPLADKLIAAAAMVMLVRLGRLPAWVVIVLLSREFMVSGLRTLAANEGMVIAAGQEGKWKTSTQLVGLLCLCIHYTHPLWFLWATYPVNYNAVGQILVYLSMFFSVWSAAGYFRAFLQMLASRKSGFDTSL